MELDPVAVKTSQDHGARPKTVDIGFNGVSVSSDYAGTVSALFRNLGTDFSFDLKILQISTFHPKHGIVLAEPYGQFDGARFRDPTYVRQYRARMLRSLRDGVPGFGIRLDRRSRFQVEHDGLGRATFSSQGDDGLEVTISVQVTEAGEVIQSVEIKSNIDSSTTLQYSLDFSVSVNRASYGQLTEGGPIPLPKSENRLSRHRHEPGFAITNSLLGAYVVGNLQDGEQNIDLSQAIIEQTFLKSPVSGKYCSSLQIPARQSRKLIAKFALQPGCGISKVSSTVEKLGMPRIWQGSETTGRFIIRRNLEYILGNCAVPLPPSRQAVCLLTDHVALPLGWMRDN
jgi:uncharacterized protein